ncbi:WecB/TagA/CpsF family glycosyltransferase [Aureimonas phyllosphaerae]|uniref:Exopolysaccharide biosynthesis WecB/TagA/CpsF family protein n=1 Tax=Aureimonas phyllosphaerae TaxID=1166078 RepID=A0A7W6BWK3_9HYPH|nr:WecB/TagA/CpsF family glycosyltransferase [Aureimonas phyllosphaerae]MBB3936463.1 exopolysaccharide biosynthesis WecB/TagA/CpsF family protein [Aureimonas phyllosphaerae]
MIDPAPIQPAAGKPVVIRKRADAQTPVRRLGGLDVAVVTGVDAIARIDAAIASRQRLQIAFVNAHCVNVSMTDADYAAVMSEMLCLPDGIGVDVGSRMLFGEPFPENLNGTDFLPRFFGETQGELRVGLVGGEPGIVDRAAERFGERFPQHRFIAVSHGFFAEGEETERLLDWIRLARLDVLLVGIGVPRQERFLARHVGVREAPVAFAVGALLDFTAGKVARAPAFVRRLRIEWIWRLLMEPRRLARRYLAGNPAFLARIARQRLRK